MITLQEAPWSAVAGNGYHRVTVLAWEHSEAAFLIPRHWVPGVAAESAGPCWAGVVVYGTNFLSVHLLDHCMEGGRGDQTVSEVISFVH